jgi:hypothetical protein
MFMTPKMANAATATNSAAFWIDSSSRDSTACEKYHSPHVGRKFLIHS